MLTMHALPAAHIKSQNSRRSALASQGEMKPPRVEAVSRQELVEGWFGVIRTAHRGKPKPGAYYERWDRGWVMTRRHCSLKKSALPPHAAYVCRPVGSSAAEMGAAHAA